MVQLDSVPSRPSKGLVAVTSGLLAYQGQLANEALQYLAVLVKDAKCRSAWETVHAISDEDTDLIGDPATFVVMQTIVGQKLDKCPVMVTKDDVCTAMGVAPSHVKRHELVRSLNRDAASGSYSSDEWKFSNLDSHPEESSYDGMSHLGLQLGFDASVIKYHVGSTQLWETRRRSVLRFKEEVGPDGGRWSRLFQDLLGEYPYDRVIRSFKRPTNQWVLNIRMMPVGKDIDFDPRKNLLLHESENGKLKPARMPLIREFIARWYDGGLKDIIDAKGSMWRHGVFACPDGKDRVLFAPVLRSQQQWMDWDKCKPKMKVLRQVRVGGHRYEGKVQRLDSEISTLWHSYPKADHIGRLVEFFEEEHHWKRGKVEVTSEMVTVWLIR